MPMLNSIKRRLIEHLATLVNELHIGSDGTLATESDGGARSLASITPTVVEGTFDTTHIYSTQVQEVYLQYKDSITGEFIPVYRTAIPSFTKDGQNEVQFSFILEVE